MSGEKHDNARAAAAASASSCHGEGGVESAMTDATEASCHSAAAPAGGSCHATEPAGEDSCCDTPPRRDYLLWGSVLIVALAYPLGALLQHDHVSILGIFSGGIFELFNRMATLAGYDVA